MNHQLTWEQLHPTVDNLGCEIDGIEYCVWSTPAELNWLKNAWNAISNNGLASYETPCDKTHVKLLGLTLTAIFCRYLEIAHNSTVHVDYFSWFEDSGIDPVHLEIITGKDVTGKFLERAVNIESYNPENRFPDDEFFTEIDVTYEDLDEEKVIAAIKAAIRMQHSQVVAALLAELGGSAGLYVSLAQTQLKQNCLDWIESGMPTNCCQLGADYS